MAKDRVPLIDPTSEFIPISLAWENICYEVDIKTGAPCARKKTTNQILINVSGIVQPGQLLAIIGSTGAGKSSLLDILANRSKQGRISGNIVANGGPVNPKSFKRISGYVTQDDCLLGTQTVEESFDFVANLKLPATNSKGDRRDKVNQIIHDLGLEKVRNAKVGSQFMRGISGGEKKRVSIGCELITDPGLLFLDEPTTGLDSFNANSVMECLTNIAKKGHTVVCTIHQPRSTIFDMFDQLMILSRGRVVYFGPAKDTVNYFAALNFHIRSFLNPADFFMDVVVANEKQFFESSSGGGVDLYQHWKESPQNASTTQLIEYQKQTDETSQLNSLSPYASSWFRQTIYLGKRSFFNYLRNPMTTYAATFQTLFMALLVGSLYFDVGMTVQSIQNRAGALFFTITNQAFSQFASLNLFILERDIFKRERASGTYRTSAYYIAKTLVETPLSIFFPTLFTVVAYWMVGFQNTPEKFGIFLLTLIVYVITAASVMIAIGTASPSLEIATILAPIAIIIFLVFGGFYLNNNSIPKYYVWCDFISLFF
eukprot:TRINITY_DN2481_c0_g1_i2.p1 TRINITY_DN2481_c0_g1~~TRINITY_DN2481_c0_g1_i2.p1  ORF type:complete len:542 (+),score=70.89 TRINITY_DN2481_c0_g1_i2:28-1653(+)